MSMQPGFRTRLQNPRKTFRELHEHRSDRRAMSVRLVVVRVKFELVSGRARCVRS
jgi:hypothetical protein